MCKVVLHTVVQCKYGPVWGGDFCGSKARWVTLSFTKTKV